MCGFFGVVCHDKDIRPLESNVQKAMSLLSHRGPDDSGFFKNKNALFAHTRLSIIDLEHEHQPMFSSDGKKIIVFNGEVFNFKELKDQLMGLGRSFRSESGTIGITTCDNTGNVTIVNYDFLKGSSSTYNI